MKGLKAWTLAFVKRARAVQHDCVSCFFVIFYILLYDIFFVLVNCFCVFLFITIFLCVLCVGFFFSGCASLRFVPFLFPIQLLRFLLSLCFFNSSDGWTCASCVYTVAARLHSFRARIYLIQSNRFSYMLFILNTKIHSDGKKLNFYQYFNRRLSNFHFLFLCLFFRCICHARVPFLVSLSFHRWVVICCWLCMRKGDSLFLIAHHYCGMCAILFSR